MNTTILLIGHGSREPEGNDEIHAFVAQWRARQPAWRIEVCFIEFAPPGLHDGLLRAAQGSQRVLVLPLILNAAGHVKMEIPEAIEHARAHCPGVDFRYGPHLTACDPILDVLRRKLRECMAVLDMPDPTTTGVVLLARGSSDRQANGDVAKMARWLQEDGHHELVDLAFTGITWPRLERVVQRQTLLGMKQIVVLPYYLYTGTLMQRIGRQVEHLRAQYPQVRFAQSQHFGLEREIFEPAGPPRGRPAGGRAEQPAAVRWLQIPRDRARPGAWPQPRTHARPCARARAQPEPAVALATAEVVVHRPGSPPAHPAHGAHGHAHSSLDHNHGHSDGHDHVPAHGHPHETAAA